MKLKDFLQQFEGLDPETEIYQTHDENDDGEIISKPRKSIFTRFYENCRSKSENFCVDCFKKLADYCKE